MFIIILEIPIYLVILVFVEKVNFQKKYYFIIQYITNKLFSGFTNKLCGIELTEFHTGYKIVSKNFHKKVPYQENSNSYLFSFQIILQAAFFKLKYGEISISSTYTGYKTSCSYLNGVILPIDGGESA